MTLPISITSTETISFNLLALKVKPMLACIRTDPDNRDFQVMVKELDADLAIRDGDEHAFYAQFNKIQSIKYVVVAYEDKEAVGCGAIKEYAPDTMEVKRMFVNAKCRGKGIASFILQELENWAKELGYYRCILETGIQQPEAIALYKKNGYATIPNYGQYQHVENSICFAKNLT